uniref:Uncharacterized protein n=1 Tax=Anopheles albimanus TaxID=7167 RepID=A0A182FZD9_ANOAL
MLSCGVCAEWCNDDSDSVCTVNRMLVPPVTYECE